MSDLVVVQRRIRGTDGARGYGWRRSLPDGRDHQANIGGLKVLDEVDPRGEMPAIYDQKQKGACTAHGVKRVLEYDRIVHGEDPPDSSREALYFFERQLEGQPLDQDTGAEGRDGFKAAQQIGLPSEKDWPYSDSTDVSQWPEWGVDPRTKLDPSTFVKLTRPYVEVPQSEQQIKAVLSNKQMIAFGFSVYESFESEAVAKHGIVPMPKPGEQVLGGHEVVAVGYLKSEPHHILCANSWGSKGTDGTEWGIDGEGCFLFPTAMLVDAKVSGDLRTIVRSVA